MGVSEGLQGENGTAEELYPVSIFFLLLFIFFFSIKFICLKIDLLNKSIFKHIQFITLSIDDFTPCLNCRHS
jgi:hypothetical protein